MTASIQDQRRERFEFEYPNLFGYEFRDGVYHLPPRDRYKKSELTQHQMYLFAWRWWNKALDSIVFVLPPTITASEVCDAFGMDDDAAGDCANMVNGAISSCGSLMKAAGLKVQP